MRSELDKKEIGSRIRKIRARRSQKEFAEVMGSTQTFISDLERGKCFPSVTFLARLAEVSGKSYDWILTGEEERGEAAERVSDTEGALETEEVQDKERAPEAFPINIDYEYLRTLVSVLEDAPPSEKPRLLKIVVSYLIAYF